MLYGSAINKILDIIEKTQSNFLAIEAMAAIRCKSLILPILKIRNNNIFINFIYLVELEVINRPGLLPRICKLIDWCLTCEPEAVKSEYFSIITAFIRYITVKSKKTCD